jgi:hypothetical protein
VELVVDRRVAGAADAAQGLLLDHLRRHAELAELVELAEPAVAAAVRASRAPVQLLSLDWSERTPRLVTTDLATEVADGVGAASRKDDGTELAPGVVLGQDLLPALYPRSRAASVEVELPVPRPAAQPVDPVPVPLPRGAAEGRDPFLAAAAALLAGPAASGRSEGERAAILGASYAELLRLGDGELPPTAAGAAAALMAAEEHI